VYQRSEPHYFGLTPHVLAGALGIASLATGVTVLATNDIVVGVLLIVAGALLIALFAEQARRRRDSSVDRVAAATIDQSLALAGFARTSAVAWTRAGRTVAPLRLEARKLAREQSKLQYELGAASFAEDEAKITDLRARMADLQQRIEDCGRDARAAIEQAQRHTSNERRAVAQTEIRTPRG
jgi:chromosome segregation ATPase